MTDDVRADDKSSIRNDLFWNIYAKCYDSIYHLMPYRKLLWDCLEALDLKSGMKLLDAGCGTGNFELFMAEKGITDVKVEAVDFSKAMLAKAKNKCENLLAVNFTKLDLNTIVKFDIDSFDRILCSNVLYTVKSPELLLKTFLGLLKPGGKMVVSDPLPDFKKASLAKDHLARFKNIRSINEKFVKAGKTIVMAPALTAASAMNIVIDSRVKKNSYQHFHEDEVDILFGNLDCQEQEISKSYADQNWLARGVKERFIQ
jgi:ubiquinone/menaquinone biosynthesis C-methylase UbiE